MALVHYEGFEGFSATIANGFDLLNRQAKFQWSFLSPIFGAAFSSPGRNNQGTAMVLGSRSVALGALTTPLESAFIGFGAMVQAGESDFCCLNFMDVTIGTQLTISLNTFLNRLDVWRGNQGSTLIASTPNNSFTGDAWNYIEAFVTIHSTGGVVILKINGQQVMNLSGINTTTTGNLSFSGLQFNGGPSAGSSTTLLVDDFYIADTTIGPGPIPFNNFVGDIRVVTINPIGNATSTQWAPLSGSNWQMVDEVHNDGDTSYNSSATPGDIDLFNFHALTGTISQVLAVQIIGSYRKDDASTREVRQQLVSGATQVDGAIYSIPGTYVYASDIFVLDPDTSLNWTISGVNALQAGYKLTV